MKANPEFILLWGKNRKNKFESSLQNTRIQSNKTIDVYKPTTNTKVTNYGIMINKTRNSFPISAPTHQKSKRPNKIHPKS